MKTEQEIEEILGRYTHDYIQTSAGTRPIIADGLVEELSTLISQERAEAVKDFAIWFEANTGGLFRGEMEAKWNEYLKASEEKE